MAGRYSKQKENRYARRKRKTIPKAKQGMVVAEPAQVPGGMDVASTTLAMGNLGADIGGAIPIPGAGMVGGVLGAGVGLATGLVQRQQAKEENKRMQAVKENTEKYGNFATNPMLQTRKELAKHGKDMKNAGLIEIEGKNGIGELHFDEEYNLKNIGTTPHSKGGDVVVAEEGDVVFPTQGNKKEQARIMNLASKAKKGNKRAYKKIEQERQSLPQSEGASQYPFGTQGVGFDDGMDDPRLTPVAPTGKMPKSDILKRFMDVNTLKGKEGAVTSNPQLPSEEIQKPEQEQKSTFEPDTVNNIMRHANITQNVIDSFSGTEGYSMTPLELERYQYQDMSAPRMQQAERNNMIRRANRRGMVGSKGQQVTQAAQDEVMAQQAIDQIAAEEIARKLQVDNLNTDLTNQELRHLTQEQMRGKDIEAKQRAVSRNLRRLGGKEIADMADVTQKAEYMQERNKKQDAMQSALYKMMAKNATSEYTLGAENLYNPDGSINEEAFNVIMKTK